MIICYKYYIPITDNQKKNIFNILSVLGEDSRSGSESSGEQDNLNVWRNLEDGGLSAHFVTPPPQLELRKGGVWARAIVPAGTRFGPFLGKWVPEPRNEDYAWEVSNNFFIDTVLSCEISNFIEK